MENPTVGQMMEEYAKVVSHPHRSQTKLQPLPISNFVLTSCLDAQFKFFEPVEKLSMPPVSYTLPQKSRISGHTVDLDSLEDRRLLGRVYNNDVEAITIRKPSDSGWGNMSPRVHNGGPRPTNTLNRPNILPDIRSSRNSTSKHSTIRRAKLELTAVRGNNVGNRLPITNSADDLTGPPSPKRRKVEAFSSPSTSSASVDEVFNSISGDQFRARANYSMSRTPPSYGQNSGVASGIKPSGNCVPEYRKLENMMKSDSRQPNRKRDQSNGRRPERSDISKSLSPLPDPLSRSNSITMINEDLQRTEPLPLSQSLHNEAALVTAERNMLSDPCPGQFADGCTFPSRYFSNTLKNSQDHESKHVSSSRAKSEAGTPKQPKSLNSQFVQVDGQRRGGPNPASSPDELMSGTTVGNQTDPTVQSPRKRSRTRSSSKALTTTLKSPGLVEDNLGLEPSNIRVSKFVAARPQKKAKSTEEAAPPWSCDLAAINLPAAGRYHQNQDLGLVHDKQSDIYKVYEGGLPAKFPGTTSQIAPLKLIRVHRECGGRKFRFESSRRGSEDNILDIEFSSKKDASDFFNRLQRSVGSVKILIIPSGKINSMFERRRDEHSTYNMTSRYAASPSTDAVTLTTRTTTNGSRTATELVSGLMDKAKIEDAQDHQAKANPSTKPQGLPQKEVGQKSSISNILDGLKPEHNNHLRRSTRTSDVSNWYTTHNRDNPEELEVVKYSEIHGLGPKWKKPLTYPKSGKKKATVDWVDLERLDEGEFLNDTLVTFYIRYLEYQMEQQNPDLAKRIYFFSTFFYERLSSTLKEKKEVNYEAVQKWTRAVDIFTYEYVVVPINEQAHWYLAIICNLPALDRLMALSDDDRTNVRRDGPNKSSSPNSPGPEMPVVKESGPLSAHQEASVEKGTTESFAELSLENAGERANALHPSSDGVASRRQPLANIQEMNDRDDDEMLDIIRQIPSDVPDPAALEEDLVEPIEDADHKPRASATCKRQKRKSFPPVTHINPKRPLIITFDSLGSPHGAVIKALKDYLLEEGKAKRGGMKFDIASIKGINAKCIPLQNNFSDCGLYMLGYVEKFLLDNPPNFVTKVIRREYKNDDWSKLVPSNMRMRLREQLQELHKHQDEEYKAFKSKRNAAEDLDASNPASSALRIVETPGKDAPSQPISSRNSSAPAKVIRDIALNAASCIDEAVSGKATSQGLRKSDPQNQISPHQGKRCRSRTPTPEHKGNKSPIIQVETPGRKHSRTDGSDSQPSADVRQQRKASDPSELPIEIEDSQPVQSMPAVSPSRLDTTRTLSPEISRQRALSSAPRSPNPIKEPTTQLSKGRTLGRPKKQWPEDVKRGRSARQIQTVVLD